MVKRLNHYKWQLLGVCLIPTYVVQVSDPHIGHISYI